MRQKKLRNVNNEKKNQRFMSIAGYLIETDASRQASHKLHYRTALSSSSYKPEVTFIIFTALTQG